jgi:hypothetical protein
MLRTCGGQFQNSQVTYYVTNFEGKSYCESQELWLIIYEEININIFHKLGRFISESERLYTMSYVDPSLRGTKIIKGYSSYYFIKEFTGGVCPPGGLQFATRACYYNRITLKIVGLSKTASLNEICTQYGDVEAIRYEKNQCIMGTLDENVFKRETNSYLKVDIQSNNSLSHIKLKNTRKGGNATKKQI